MNLETYLSNSTDTQASLAEKLNVSQGLISQWIKGKTRITAERAKEIERATKGKVKRHELRPDIFGDSL